MNVRRIAILMGREVVLGWKSFMFVFAIVVPLVITLLVNLLFGSFFSGKPRLGMAAADSSRLLALARDMDGLITKAYDSEDSVRQAVSEGVVDVGVLLPAGFEERVVAGESTTLTAFVYGESLLKDRVLIETAIVVLLRQLAGQEAPVEVVAETVGDGKNVPWEDRLLPLIVMMTILVGGVMVTATSVVEEKERRMFIALATSPATVGEIFAAKGATGAWLSLVMGVIILALNGVFGAHPWLLIGLLALGAIMSALVGLVAGALVKDINTLFATIKSMGILLYAPAILYMFPEIPAWIGKVFPTYYMIDPVVEITQHGASWPDVALHVAILAGLTLALGLGVARLAQRLSREPATA